VIALDDRTGNVLTTVALFAVVAGVVYAARTTLAVFILSLLFAYLLEPAVSWVQGRLRQPSKRAGAISVVYLTATVMVAGLGYLIAPAVGAQLARLNGELPGLLARITDQRFLAAHGASLARVVERLARALGKAAQATGWLLTVPIFAIFFLNNRPALIDGTVELFARQRDKASVKHTVERIDTMLAQYIRSQLALAGLSAVIYSASMALLGYPYALVLGVMAGMCEFLPVVGWVLAAAIMLTTGWLTDAHWLAMGGVIACWRVVLNFAVSPRVMGNRLELEPMTVIFALMAGGQIGGVLGVVLSVPAVAVLRILWLENASRRNAAAA
jgi:predicted PurR-regulated permease PerM